MLQLPTIQHYIGNVAASVISKKIGSKVVIDGIDISIFNRVTIKNITIYDQKKKVMLDCSHISTQPSLLYLLKGDVILSSAQVFNLKANLYKQDDKSKPNYQFLLDSLKSKDNTSTNKWLVEVNTLILRNANIKYDLINKPHSTNLFNANHINIRNLNGIFALNKLSSEQLNLDIYGLNFNEQCGFEVKDMACSIKAENNKFELNKLILRLPKSRVEVPQIVGSFNNKNNKTNKNNYSYNGEIINSHINTADVSCFYEPLKDMNKAVFINSKIIGTNKTLHIPNLNVLINDGLKVNAQCTINFYNNDFSWKTNINEFKIENNLVSTIYNNIYKKAQIPDILKAVSFLSFKGTANGTKHTINTNGQISTNLGDISLKANCNKINLNAEINTNTLNLGVILPETKLGKIVGNIMIAGKNINSNPSFNVAGNIKEIEFDKKIFTNISLTAKYYSKIIEGKLCTNSEKGLLSVDGRVSFNEIKPHLTLTAEAKGISTDILKNTYNPNNAKLSFNMQADIQGKNINDFIGTTRINNIVFATNKVNGTINNMYIKGELENNIHNILLSGDFGDINLRGNLNIDNILNTAKNIVKHNLFNENISKNNTANNFEIKGNITNANIIQLLIGKQITLYEPIFIYGKINEKQQTINVLCNIPTLNYDNQTYKNNLLKIDTNTDSIKANVYVNRISNKKTLETLELSVNSKNKQIYSNLKFNNGSIEKPILMDVSTSTNIKQNMNVLYVNTSVLPSKITFYDMQWNLKSSDITYVKNSFNINNLTLNNGSQNITIDGIASNKSNDSLTIAMHNVKVDDISNILNVSGVEFGGKLYGNITAKSLLESPQINGDIRVDDFEFTNGKLGTLYANAAWNNKDKKVYVNAQAIENSTNKTIITGDIATSPLNLNLNIQVSNTQVGCLNTYCKSFLQDIDVRATGGIHIYGPGNNINIVGDVVANGAFKVSSLNTAYTMKNTNVKLLPNAIIFNNANIQDIHNNNAIVTGTVNHKNLGNWRYNFNIDANNFLSYDFKNFDDNTFCGTVYATGKCVLEGEPGRANIDINVTPNKNSIIKYRDIQTKSTSNNTFIHWKEPQTNNRNKEKDKKDHIDIQSDLIINMIINSTPNLTLRVIMNDETNDYIDLRGKGYIRAEYYNKGAFSMYGNYNVEDGFYKTTIQNIIKKEFYFLNNGGIIFNGNPMYAQLNLTARHTVSGVNLGDLNIGKNFNNSTTRVNCLMNINGTPQSPQVSFDIDVPSLSTDAQQMLRNIINSQEELNQQVVCLLTIGRFYNTSNQQSQNAQTQTSLAMQSLLSGAISQQINSMVQAMTNSSNWSFGANISTGDEGWNNAQYEGIFSGKLLNNRLVINGQVGYRDNTNATTSFIGDFNLQYLLTKNGNISLNVYNQTNNRYFIQNTLNTQGIGIMLKKDFTNWKDLFKNTFKKKEEK